MVGTGGAADRLVHQRATKIVDTSAEHHARTLGAKLDPRRLNVLDPRVEHEARRRVQDNRLVEGRAVAGLALESDRRLFGDKRQRHEFGKAARLALEVANAVQVARDVDRALDMAEHDRRGRAEPDAVCGAHHLEPLLGVDLVGAEHGAHFVVKDLGGGAREAAEPGLLQLAQVVLEGPLHRRRALPDFEWRERVDVDLGLGCLDGAQHFEVPLAGEARMDPTLQTDLGAAALPGLDRTTGDLAGLQQIGGAAEVLGEAPLREGAEATAEIADVGVVDVAADDVGDVVADTVAAALIREPRQERDLGAARVEQRLGVFEVEQLLGFGACECLGKGG